MGYNHGSAELKWRKEMEKEEMNMREASMTDEQMKSIREFDRRIFNSDRRFYERNVGLNEIVENTFSATGLVDISNFSQILNEIENKNLFEILKNLNPLTQKILLLKVNRYSVREISETLDISPKMIYRRMDRLKQKIKNIS